MFKLSMKMLKREMKSSLFYTATMVVAVTMIFIFSSIFTNPQLKSETITQSGATWAQISLPISELLSFVVICFCCFLIFYVNNYYVLNKANEIAILATSGSSSLNTAVYLLSQTSLLFLIACIPGVALGYALTIKINEMIASFTSGTIQPITASSLGFTFVLIFTVFIMLVIVVSGYVYRNEIKTLLYSQDNMNVTGAMSKLKIPTIIFVGIYVASVILIILPGSSIDAFSTYIGLALVGIYGLVAGGISNSCSSWKKKNMHKNRYTVVSVSNLSYTILKSKWLILLLVFSVIAMFYLTAIYQSVPQEFVIALAGYVIIIILLSASIMYNLMIEIKGRGTLYFNMWKIGYVKKELFKIGRQEILYYYGIILMLPLFLMFALGYRYMEAQIMQLPLFVGLCIVYIIFILLTGMICMGVYKQTINENIIGEK